MALAFGPRSLALALALILEGLGLGLGLVSSVLGLIESQVFVNTDFALMHRLVVVLLLGRHVLLLLLLVLLLDNIPVGRVVRLCSPVARLTVRCVAVDAVCSWSGTDQVDPLLSFGPLQPVTADISADRLTIQGCGTCC